MVVNAKQWQTLGVVAVFTLLITAVSLRLFGYNLDLIVIIDLSFGLVGLLLAMYVYGKEKKLEYSIKTLTKNKTQQAYASILTNIMIFEKILDDIFVGGYIQGDQELQIGNKPSIYIHHNNLKLEFFAHADVLEKNMMGRLSQYVSLLDIYVKEDKIQVIQHMDNMHDMEILIRDIIKKIDDGQSIDLIRDNFLRTQRHNRFMLFTLDELKITINKNKDNVDILLRDVVLTIYDFDYYLHDSSSVIIKQTLIKILELEAMLAKYNANMDNHQDILNFIDILSEDIKKYDGEVKIKRQKWVEHLQDYSRIINPLLFLIDLMNNVDDFDALKGGITIREQLILNEIPKSHYMHSDVKKHVQESLETSDLEQSRDEYVAKLQNLKEYLSTNLMVVQEERYLF